MGEKAFQQCAGFLRIPGADNVLDNTAVHPERYELIEQIAADNGGDVEKLVKDASMRRSVDFVALHHQAGGIAYVVRHIP